MRTRRSPRRQPGRGGLETVAGRPPRPAGDLLDRRGIRVDRMSEQSRPFDVRRAGVLLHVTSLPGAGDLGEEAYRFVDFLADAGFTVWQVLPLVPTHDDDGSPYNAPSAMAGNPDLISPTLREPMDDAAFTAWCGAPGDW